MPTAVRRLLLLLVLGGVTFAALVESGLLAYRRRQNCFDWESEGRTAAIASPQGWVCGGQDPGDWTPDFLVSAGTVVLAVVVALLLWRRWGIRGWFGGVVALLALPLVAHAALVLPPDSCSAETIRANDGRDCSTDREKGPDLPEE